MNSMIGVRGKQIGKKRPLFPEWRLPIPGEFYDGSRRLRDLLELVVRNEVAAFLKREDARQEARVLSALEIESGRIAGKVDMGGREPGDEAQTVDVDAAVATALQAFEDGIFLVFLDDEEKRDLDETIFVQPDSLLLFVRLTLLSGF